MRLKSQQQQQGWWWRGGLHSTNQRLTTYVTTISVIISAVAVVVLHGFCLQATSSVDAAAISSSHPAAIQIGDPKQRIIRQVAEDDRAVDDACDCDPLDGAYHKPHFAKGRSVIVELFEWKFIDVAEECRRFLGPMGYGGVQISPVLEHTIIKTNQLQHPWWQRFETVSYRFASRSGDESDFWSMTRICNDNGVRIYLDVVLNHMAAPLNRIVVATKEISNFTVNTLLESEVNISNMSYPNVPYAAEHFHRPCAVGDSWAATHDIRNCQLNGHPDLDLGNPHVQQNIVAMLNRFIDMGVAGFRMHSAKYVWPNDFKNIYGKLKCLSKDFGFNANARPFIYHDIFDMGLDSISKTEYATFGAVTEYLYPIELSAILRGKAPLSALINWGPAMGFLAHQDSVVFVDNPETQRGLPMELGNNRVLSFRHRQKYIMANALMMAHSYGGFKRIMSSYYFEENNIDQGPPTEEGDEDTIRSPEFDENDQCSVASGWVCEHRWPEIVNLVALANYFSVPEHYEQSIRHFQTDGPNHIAFCRGSKAFIAMNNDPDNDFIKDVFACLEPGTYCDVISGGLKEGAEECHGHSLTINDDGYAKLQLLVADNPSDDKESNIVENLGVLVIYLGSKVGSNMERVWSVNDLGDPDENEAITPRDDVDLEADDLTGEDNLDTNDQEDGNAKDVESSKPEEDEAPEQVDNANVNEDEDLEGEAKENDGDDTGTDEGPIITDDEADIETDQKDENNPEENIDEVEEDLNSNIVNGSDVNEDDVDVPDKVKDTVTVETPPVDEDIEVLQPENGAESTNEEDMGENEESKDEAETTNEEETNVDVTSEVQSIEGEEGKEIGEDQEDTNNEEMTEPDLEGTSRIPLIEDDEKKETGEDLVDRSNEEETEAKVDNTSDAPSIEADEENETGGDQEDTNNEETTEINLAGISEDPTIEDDEKEEIGEDPTNEDKTEIEEDNTSDVPSVEAEEKNEIVEDPEDPTNAEESDTNAEDLTIKTEPDEGFVIEPTPTHNEVGPEPSEEEEQIASETTENVNDEESTDPGEILDKNVNEAENAEAVDLEDIKNPEEMEKETSPADNPGEDEMTEAPESDSPADNPGEDEITEAPVSDREANEVIEVDDLNTEQKTSKEEVDSIVSNSEGKTSVITIPDGTNVPRTDIERPIVVSVQQAVYITPGSVNANQATLENTEVITTEGGSNPKNAINPVTLSETTFPALSQQLQGSGQMKRCYPQLHGLILLQIFVISFHFKNRITFHLIL